MSRENTPTHQRVMAENVIASFLNAAEALIKLGDMTQAELRLRDALKQADSSFGHNSRVVRHVLTAMVDFYRSQQRVDALAAVEKRLELILGSPDEPEQQQDPNTSYGKLIAIARKNDKPPLEHKINPARVPPEVRKACQILGLPLEELAVERVRQAWKQAISNPSVHPDLGGEHEVAILLNTARDTILQWLEEQSPKLLKKFERIVRKNN